METETTERPTKYRQPHCPVCSAELAIFVDGPALLCWKCGTVTACDAAEVAAQIGGGK
jgi:hypothetical protein